MRPARDRTAPTRPAYPAKPNSSIRRAVLRRVDRVDAATGPASFFPFRSLPRLIRAATRLAPVCPPPGFFPIAPPPSPTRNQRKTSRLPPPPPPSGAVPFAACCDRVALGRGAPQVPRDRKV